MGGATLCVLSPYANEQLEPTVVEALIAHGLIQDPDDASSWRPADGLPYGYDIQSADFDIEPAELRHVESATGATMRSQIALHVYVSDLAGRRLLARLAQRVALRTAGWVFVEFAGSPSAELLRHLTHAGECIRVDDAV